MTLIGHPLLISMCMLSLLLTFEICCWETRGFHSLRESNACEDFLAKAKAHLDNDFVLIQDSPANLAPLLLADALGASFPRA